MKTTKREIMKKGILKSGLALVAAASMPFIALAATAQTNPCTTQQSLCTLIYKAIGYFNEIIYLIIALAVMTFIWNVYHYFIVNDPENRKEASKYVMFSVIGLFVILSFWGLVNIISNTLNLNTAASQINVGALTGSGGSAVSTPSNANVNTPDCINGDFDEATGGC